jgi:hypothetical protein
MQQLIAQLDCPITGDVETFLAAAKRLKSAGAFHLYDPGGGLSPLALGSLLQEELGKEIYLHLHPADRNRAALFSELITANAVGLEKIVLGAGQHPAKTLLKEAKPVFDLDLLQLLRMALYTKSGFDPAGRSMKGEVFLQIGVLAKVDSPLELFRLRQMVDMGADYVFLKWPSKLLILAQLPKEIGKPTYLSLALEEARGFREEDWGELKASAVAGINLRIPGGKEDEGEEVLRWYFHYLSSES